MIIGTAKNKHIFKCSETVQHHLKTFPFWQGDEMMKNVVFNAFVIMNSGQFHAKKATDRLELAWGSIQPQNNSKSLSQFKRFEVLRFMVCSTSYKTNRKVFRDIRKWCRHCPLSKLLRTLSQNLLSETYCCTSRVQRVVAFTIK